MDDWDFNVIHGGHVPVPIPCRFRIMHDGVEYTGEAWAARQLALQQSAKLDRIIELLERIAERLGAAK